MTRTRLLMAVLAITLIAWAWPGASVRASTRPVSPAAVLHLGRGALVYEPNVGQFAGSVLFAARGSGFSLLLQHSGMVLLPGGAASPVRLRFAGANAHAAVTASSRMRERVNYFLGRNPAGWHRNVPTFAGVEYHDLYPGIDLRFRGSASAPEFDWIVHPGANPARIGLTITGSGFRVRSGKIAIHAAGQNLTVPAPGVYQRIGARTVHIAGGYRLDRGVVRVALGRYDRSHALVIDPTVLFSHLVGGSDQDTVTAVTTDTSGDVFAVGNTASADFTLIVGGTQPMFQKTCQITTPQCRSVLVTEYSPAGAPIFSTFIGGSGFDSADSVSVDAPGNVFVAGHTGSANFPLANPQQSSFRASCPDLSGASVACEHIFLIKFDSTGANLLYSTYFGGSNQDLDAHVAVNAAGEAYLTGLTESSDLPGIAGTPPQGHCAADPLVTGDHLCAQTFLAKLAPSGRLDYDVYFGGTGDDAPESIAINRTGQPVIAGATTSTDLPLAQAAQSNSGGGSCASRPCLDGFVAQFGNSDGSLALSTYLGGAGDDYANQVAFDSGGSMYVTGTTYSTNFPLTSALQGTKPAAAAADASCTLTKLSTSGQIVYSTYLGGAQNTQCLAGAVDASGDAFVGGIATSATGLTLTNATQSSYGGGDTDGFILELKPTGSAVLFGTLLGGSAHDEVDSMAIGSAGSVIAGGWTTSPNFPATGSQTLSGGSDGFVTSVDPTAAKPVTCPKHASLKKGKCACKKGYVMKKGKCVKKKKKK